MINTKYAKEEYLIPEESPRKGSFGCRVFEEDGNGPNEVLLYAPNSFYNLSDSAILESTGGCGPGKAGDLIVPDTAWGLNLKRACRIHDHMYSDLCTATKKAGDRVFLNNMRRLIIHGSKIKWLIPARLRRAKLYFLTVKYGGKAAVSKK